MLSSQLHPFLQPFLICVASGFLTVPFDHFKHCTTHSVSDGWWSGVCRGWAKWWDQCWRLEASHTKAPSSKQNLDLKRCLLFSVGACFSLWSCSGMTRARTNLKSHLGWWLRESVDWPVLPVSWRRENRELGLVGTWWVVVGSGQMLLPCY